MQLPLWDVTLYLVKLFMLALDQFIGWIDDPNCNYEELRLWLQGQVFVPAVRGLII